MDTNNGPVRILQPTTSQNPQPLDQQDHDTSQVKQETPCPPLTLQEQEENNDAPTIPSSISPGLISSEDSESDDCIIEKIERVSPCPKLKLLKEQLHHQRSPLLMSSLKRSHINKVMDHIQSQQHKTLMDKQLDKQLHKTTLDLTITTHPKDLDYKTKHHSLQLLQALIQHKPTKTESIRKIRKTIRKTKRKTKTKTTRLLQDFFIL